jgi:phosphoglycolate phosphatase-like HAD superfamily hydrolase
MKQYKGLIVFDYAGTMAIQNQIFPEVHHVIKELSNDYLIAIVSSSDEFVIRATLESFALLDKVMSIYGNESGDRKATSITKLYKMYNIRPQKTIFIGDQMSDMTEGDKAGVLNIFATWGFGKFVKDSSYNMIGIINSPGEIIPLVNKYIRE